MFSVVQSGDQKLSNLLQKYKNRQSAEVLLLFFKYLILLVVSIPSAAWADSIPVKMTWPTQINVSQGFQLQIGSDPGFATVVLEDTVSDQHYEWDAPQQGVYHWRLLRGGDAGSERNTFISGSFAAVNPAINEGDPPRLTWAPVEGADRYKLYVFEGGARQRLMVTADTIFLIPKVNVPLMVEVVPFVGGRRLAREFRLNDSLLLEGNLPQDAEPPEPSADPAPIVEPTPTPEPAPEPVVESEPAPEPAPEEAPEPAPEPAPVAEAKPEKERAFYRRAQILYGYLFGVRERLRAQKLEIDIDSNEQESGTGVGLWVGGSNGLVVSAMAEYYEHRAEITAPTTAGEVSYEIQQSRYFGEFTLGYDLLASADIVQHLLTLYVAGAMTQVPLLPLEFAGEPGVLPGLSGAAYYLYGGGVQYGFFDYRFGAFLSGGYLVDIDEKIKVFYQRLLLEYYPAEGLTVQFGGFARLSAVKTCSDDAVICLREGAVRTTAEEKGLSIGMGYSFF